MSIGADLIRGHTDAIILSLLREKDSYGYEINKTISQVSGGRYELKEATLYTAFKRLEDGGLITSYWGDQGAGARRKYLCHYVPGGRDLLPSGGGVGRGPGDHRPFAGEGSRTPCVNN